MGPWHLWLLALAGGAAALGVRAAPCRVMAVQALASFAAMAAAMATGRLPVILAATAVLMAAGILPVVLRRAGGAMNLHRSASCLVMGLVLAGLAALNGGAVCGAAAVPLLTAQGVPRLLLAPGPLLLAWAAATACLLYLAISLLLAARCRRPFERAETLLMCAATLGMALPAP